MVVLSLISIVLTGMVKNTSTPIISSKEDHSNKNEVIESKINKINISSIGDIMVHDPQLNAQFDKSTNTYFFDNNFKYVKNYLEHSDLSIGNLETTFAGSNSNYSSYPFFNSPDSLADAIKLVGVDNNLLINMPNLPLDKAKDSYHNTLEQIKQSDIIKVINNPFN